MCSPSSRGRTANGSERPASSSGPCSTSPATCWRSRSPRTSISSSETSRICETSSNEFSGLGRRIVPATATCVACTRSASKRTASTKQPRSRPEGLSNGIPATSGLCTRRPMSSRWREPSVWGSRSWTTPSTTGPPATSPPTTGGTARSTTLSFGKSTRPLALYDGPIRGTRSSEWLDVDDAASLLWRLHLFGVDIGDRARTLLEDVEGLLDDPVSVFNDWHAVMIAGLAGAPEVCEQLILLNRSASGGHQSPRHRSSRSPTPRGLRSLRRR